MYNFSLHSPKKIGKELNYIKKVIDSSWFADGEYIKTLSEKINRFTKSKYSVPIINGTSALHISLKVLGVNSNHEVIVPTLTFIAPINAVRYCNATPIFMDCNKYLNIDEVKLEDFLINKTYNKNGQTYNKKNNKLIKAMIIVHTFGNSANIFKILKICKKFKIKLIEDASESLGTFYQPRLKNKIKFHTGIIGDFGCLSFNGNKIISAGGGGLILTQNKKYYEKIKYLIAQAKDDSIKFIHNEIGYNYKFNNIQAAICCAQFEKIQLILKEKRRVRKNYLNNIKNLKNNYQLKLLDLPEYSISNNWINILKFNSKVDLYKFILNLNNKGIFVRPIWHLNHLQKQFKKYQSYKIEQAIRK